MIRKAAQTFQRVLVPCFSGEAFSLPEVESESASLSGAGGVKRTVRTLICHSFTSIRLNPGCSGESSDLEASLFPEY